jgi:hypothetical protein
MYDEYGERQKTINVVYYFDQITCSLCKGNKVLPYDNRVPIDFSVQFDKPAKPEPYDEECYRCSGTGFEEMIDYKSMTPKQIKIYKDYQDYRKRSNEKYIDYLSEEKTLSRARKDDRERTQEEEEE